MLATLKGVNRVAFKFVRAEDDRRARWLEGCGRFLLACSSRRRFGAWPRFINVTMLKPEAEARLGDVRLAEFARLVHFGVPSALAFFYRQAMGGQAPSFSALSESDRDFLRVQGIKPE